MSQTAVGQVAEVSSFNWKGPNGAVDLWSFQLDGDSRYFRTGSDKPSISTGDNIRFTFEQKGRNQNVDLSSIEQVAATEVAAAPPPPAATQARGNARDKYWEDKDAYDKQVTGPRINFSASQRDAISLVTAALEQDCLSFGNAAKGKKLDMLLEFVDQITDRFVEQRIATSEQG